VDGIKGQKKVCKYLNYDFISYCTWYDKPIGGLYFFPWPFLQDSGDVYPELLQQFWYPCKNCPDNAPPNNQPGFPEHPT